MKTIKVAVSGFSGCGNTTVSHMLAELLGVPCINYTFRNLATDLQMELSDIIDKAQTDLSFDRMVDSKQLELASVGPCVLGSRLAVWLLKEADLRIFLTASPEVRAKRISEREKTSLETTLTFTQKRDAQDSERYRTLYNIDNKDYSFVDLVINTEYYTPEKICHIIKAALDEKLKSN